MKNINLYFFRYVPGGNLSDSDDDERQRRAVLGGFNQVCFVYIFF